MEEIIQEPPKMSMNINVPENNALVKSEQIISICSEIIKDINEEKVEINEAYNNFAEMVFNAGDATSSSKEALVNLLKLKSDIIDKKSKLMDSMLKLHNQSGVKTIHANQHNEINFIDKGKLIRELNKKQEITETDK